MNIPDTFTGPGLPSAVPSPPTVDPLLITDAEYALADDPDADVFLSLGTAAKLMTAAIVGRRGPLGVIATPNAAEMLLEGGLPEGDVLDLLGNAWAGADGAVLRLIHRLEGALFMALHRACGGQP